MIKYFTSTARPLRIGSPLINVRVSLLSSSVGCSHSLSVQLILATCAVDLLVVGGGGGGGGGGGPAVGGSKSTESGIKCFLKRCGSRKILA